MAMTADAAAHVSAEEQIHNRGTTAGYWRHYWHLGQLHAARGRWREAAESFLDAEIRGMGPAATPDLEAAWRRSRGSLRGLEAARTAERARVRPMYQCTTSTMWTNRPPVWPPVEKSQYANRLK